MIIQFNTDKTINGSEKNNAFFSSLIKDGLKKYSDYVTRIEVHLSDENGAKSGLKDIRCLLEARIEGKPPIAVTKYAETAEGAVSEAIDKMRVSLKTSIAHPHQN